MNNFHLRDLEVREAVARTWGRTPLMGFTGKLQKITKFYKLYCTRKARDWRSSEADLRSQLASLQANLQADLYNAEAQKQLSFVTDSVVAFEKHTAKGQCIQSRV